MTRPGFSAYGRTPLPATVPADGPPSPGTGPIGFGRADRPALGWTELVLAAVTYVGVQLGVAVAFALVVPGGRTPGALWLIGGSALSAFAAVAVAGAVRVRSLAALGMRAVPARTVGLGVLAGLATRAVAEIVLVGYAALTGDRADPQAALFAFHGVAATVAAVVLAGLVVPCGEELLFRGVGYGALRRHGAPLAAGVSAAVFAVGHGFTVVLVPALLLGLVNARLYERTRSVWPGVAAHVTFNLTALLALLALR